MNNSVDDRNRMAVARFVEEASVRPVHAPAHSDTDASCQRPITTSTREKVGVGFPDSTVLSYGRVREGSIYTARPGSSL